MENVEQFRLTEELGEGWTASATQPRTPTEPNSATPSVAARKGLDLGLAPNPIPNPNPNLTSSAKGKEGEPSIDKTWAIDILFTVD